MSDDDVMSLLVTIGLVAAGVLVAALLVDLTMRRYAILAPATNLRAVPDVDEGQADADTDR